MATLEKQPQKVTSPDNKLQILNHRVYFDRFGCACVEGAVKNLTDRTDLIANLKVDYYDYDGIYINSEIQSLPVKYGHRAIGFHIMYSGPQSTETTYYKISFV